jgi:hypothetical protein
MAINFLNTVAVDENVLFVDTVNDRVGIGTASPDYLLDLYKSTATTSSSTGTTLQRLWNYVGSDLNQQKTFVDFVFQDDNDNEYPQVRIGAEVGQNGDSDTQLKEGSGAFVVYTNNATGNGPGTPTGLAERFRVDYKGNVGIGTDSPAAGLQVALGGTTIPAAGASTASAVFGNSTSDDNYGVAIGANSSGVGYISSQRTDGTATTYNLAIQSNGGNVGIGTDSPLTNLHIANSGSAAQLSLERTDTSDTLKLVIGSSYGYLQNTTGPLSLGTIGGTQQVYIATDGDVGINTTTPGSKLDVDGTFGVSDLPFNTDSVSVLVADETIGAELITNGNFATDSDWTKSSNVSISGGQATFTANSAAQYIIQGSLWPANSLSGQKVKLTYTIVSNSLNAGDFRIGGYTGASAFTLNGLVTTVGTHNIILDVRTTAGDDNAIDLYITSAATSGALVIDNVSVKQVTSASNQIQKRELGTGAFGPTPVGAYLPLSAGSGSPLTGHLFIDTPAGASQSGYALKLNKTNSSSVVQVGAEIFATPWASNTNGGTIVFKNADAATNLQETLRISANGSVGINSTSSSFKLDVGGNARFQDSVYIDTSTGSGGLYVTRLGSASESLKIYTSDSTSVFETFQDENTGVYGSMAFVLDNGAPDPDFSFKYGSQVRLKIEGGTGDVILGDALLSSQEDTDIDTGVGIVAQVAHATYTAAFFDFVVKKGTNVRSGTVYACHNGDTTPLVEFTETSTNDLGDTSDVTLSVDISGDNMRLLATVTSDDWSVKSLIRAI